MRKSRIAAVAGVAALLFATAAFSEDKVSPPVPEKSKPAKTAKVEKNYAEATQPDLSSGRETFDGKAVVVSGQFLFTGSDFCYQIRKTKINTRDYLCFALGPMNLIRFYLKKDHPQVDELLKVKKGTMIKAFGTFDSIGNDYKYVIVDHFEATAN